MTKSEAHAILEGVKNGIPTSIIEINKALIVTGDLRTYEGNRGDGMAGQVQGTGLPEWLEPRESMVG